MELVNTIMGQRQRKYREMYRERVSGWYNGWLHVMIIYLAGSSALYIYGANTVNVQWWEWLALPFGFISYQASEYILHMYVMHRPRKNVVLRALYIRHTLMHHQFFTKEEMRFADHKDWRVTFFPPFTMLGLTLLSIIPSLAAGIIISENVGWLLMAAFTASYMFYELIHFCTHIDDNWLIRNMPLINTARRHHTAHHDHQLMMSVNMGIGTALPDWMMGTSDLDRGFWGHLFNGYDESHVRPGLQKSFNAAGTRPVPNRQAAERN